MAYLKRVALGLCLLLVFGLGTAQAADKEKQEAIAELLKITKTAELTEQVTVDSLWLFLGLEFKKRPEIPDEVKQKTYDILVETFRENLDGLMVPISQLYEQTFTLAEIQDLIKFYKTEVGQKVITELPGIMQKSMVIGGQWGQKIGVIAVERIRKELANKGYDI